MGVVWLVLCLVTLSPLNTLCLPPNPVILSILANNGNITDQSDSTRTLVKGVLSLTIKFCDIQECQCPVKKYCTLPLSIENPILYLVFELLSVLSSHNAKYFKTFS